jgi:hypothetical protein
MKTSVVVSNSREPLGSRDPLNHWRGSRSARPSSRGALPDRVVDPAPDFVDEVGDVVEASPSVQRWIHEFARHLSAPFDDDAQHEHEMTFGRKLVCRITFRHEDLIASIRTQLYLPGLSPE